MQLLEVWYRVFQSRQMTPLPDPAVQLQQGWYQQNDHDEVGLQEEKVVDPSLLID